MCQSPLRMISLLAVFALSGPAFADPPDPLGAAVAKSLTLLQKSTAEYTVHRQCFSCHHQALPILVFTEARKRGFEVDEKELQRQLKFTADFLAKNRANYLQGKGQGGQADTAGYALLSLDAGGWKADATTEAVVEYLLLRDKEREQWQVTSQRPPTEASSFTTTYLALHALRSFGPPLKLPAIESRFERAYHWLVLTPVKDTEDRVFRLQALKLLKAEKAILKGAGDELLKSQRDDGGWSQTDKLESDAYATGSALTALHQVAGLPTRDPAYQRGVQFLLKTQQGDGSWHVRSRSKPFQLYFESGFPHGKDQFISIAASSWATIALTLACEPAVKKSAITRP